MFCPQCSQQQVAGEMRFCSRCGFPLTIVSQLVSSGGALEGFDVDGNRQLSPRQKGIRKGALFMIPAAPPAAKKAQPKCVKTSGGISNWWKAPRQFFPQTAPPRN